MQSCMEQMLRFAILKTNFQTLSIPLYANGGKQLLLKPKKIMRPPCAISLEYFLLGSVTLHDITLPLVINNEQVELIFFGKCTITFTANGSCMLAGSRGFCLTLASSYPDTWYSLIQVLKVVLNTPLMAVMLHVHVQSNLCISKTLQIPIFYEFCTVGTTKIIFTNFISSQNQEFYENTTKICCYTYVRARIVTYITDKWAFCVFSIQTSKVLTT